MLSTTLACAWLSSYRRDVLLSVWDLSERHYRLVEIKDHALGSRQFRAAEVIQMARSGPPGLRFRCHPAAGDWHEAPLCKTLTHT